MLEGAYMHHFDRMPAVPLTIEGSAVLHQMTRVKWPAWRALAAGDREAILTEATAALDAAAGEGTAAFAMLGHKAELMLIHFRPGMTELLDIQSRVSHLRLWDYLEQTTSYVSVVELGLYESTLKTYSTLMENGVEPHSAEWTAAIGDTLERQREAMKPRLFPEIPAAPYVCFYPMDRKRGEQKNWYQLALPERQRQMSEHGMIGRRYAGSVKQIITGSIGFDDWEWGVDLFAEDPLVFKKLIYEMRFDEVSAVYALFGQLYVGKRLDTAGLRALLTV
jgi:chlorite dismutase